MDKERDQAAANLYRVAQATALLRLYSKSEGREAANPEILTEWLKNHPEVRRPIKPSRVDHKSVERARPDLASIAWRRN